MIVRCPQCQAQLKVADEAAGRPFRCPKCQNVFKAPAGVEAPPVPSSERAGAPPAPEAPPPPPRPGPPPAPRFAARRARRAAREGPMKKLAAGAFGVTLLCFLLPFFHISCAGTRVLTVSGLTLVAGGEARMGSDLKEMASLGEETPGAQVKGGKDAPRVDPEALAILAAIAVAAGVVFCLLKGKAGATGGIAAAACAVALLFALMWKLDSDIKREAQEGTTQTKTAARPRSDATVTMSPGLERAMEQGFQGMVKIEAASGFIIAVGLLVVAGALSGGALYRLSQPPARGPS